MTYLYLVDLIPCLLVVEPMNFEREDEGPSPQSISSVLNFGLVMLQLGLSILSVKFDSIRYLLRFDPKILDIHKVSKQSKY